MKETNKMSHCWNVQTVYVFVIVVNDVKKHCKQKTFKKKKKLNIDHNF